MCCLEREERSKRQVQEKYVVAAGPSFLPFASAIVKGSMRFYGHLTPSAATAPYPPPSASPIAEVPYLASHLKATTATVLAASGQHCNSLPLILPAPLRSANNLAVGTGLREAINLRLLDPKRRKTLGNLA
ncbi:Uncharacterized protein HZ326_3364 [Fusarium oxysporum f. sp. albedinis]|nr:Uncharacterized protein HZ326_3364 [Fusarium oxysporum f. sp. albedinis]